jgi:hypothetical protein
VLLPPSVSPNISTLLVPSAEVIASKVTRDSESSAPSYAAQPLPLPTLPMPPATAT